MRLLPYSPAYHQCQTKLEELLCAFVGLRALSSLYSFQFLFLLSQSMPSSSLVSYQFPSEVLSCSYWLIIHDLHHAVWHPFLLPLLLLPPSPSCPRPGAMNSMQYDPSIGVHYTVSLRNPMDCGCIQGNHMADVRKPENMHNKLKYHLCIIGHTFVHIQRLW